MIKECSHNWEQEANKMYCQCLICGQRYNVGRLLNELQNKVEQMESQAAVMRGALEEIQATINELGNDVLHNKSNGGWMLLNINAILDKAISVTPVETGQKLQELERFAELGRLAVECGNPCSGIYEKSCPKVCDKYNFCQKRAELLTGEKND